MSSSCQDEYNALQGEFVHGYYLNDFSNDERWQRMDRLLSLAMERGAEQEKKTIRAAGSFIRKGSYLKFDEENDRLETLRDFWIVPVPVLALTEKKEENKFVPMSHMLRKMMKAAEMLWTVLANVDSWDAQPKEWQDAAIRWRDYYFDVLDLSPGNDNNAKEEP